MADAASSADLDGLADVKGEVRGEQAEPEFASVQRDRHVVGEKVDICMWRV